MREEGYSSCPVCLCVCVCPFSLFCLLALLGVQREVPVATARGSAVYCCHSWNIEWVTSSMIGQYIFVVFRYGHPKLQIRPTYQYHWNVQVLTNVTVVCICCMVLEVQLFFLPLWGPSSWKHSATTFWNAWIKNNCILRTMQRIQMGLVPLRW